MVAKGNTMYGDGYHQSCGGFTEYFQVPIQLKTTSGFLIIIRYCCGTYVV